MAVHRIDLLIRTCVSHGSLLAGSMGLLDLSWNAALVAHIVAVRREPIAGWHQVPLDLGEPDQPALLHAMVVPSRPDEPCRPMAEDPP